MKLSKLTPMLGIIALLTAAWPPLPKAVAQSDSVTVLAPWQTVDLEHADRKQRLMRLSGQEGISAPGFFEYTIPQAQHHLTDYPVSIPVLRVVFRDRVFFDFNGDAVKPEAVPVIETIAASLRLEPPDVTVFIAGHTDSVGTTNYNLQL